MSKAEAGRVAMSRVNSRLPTDVFVEMHRQAKLEGPGRSFQALLEDACRIYLERVPKSDRKSA